MIKLSEDKLKQIEKELDGFDLHKDTFESAINYNTSAAINDLVAKIAQGLAQGTALYILIKLGGTAGLVLAGFIFIQGLAGALKAYSLIRSEREIRKEYSRFMQQLKDKGIYDQDIED
jgi:hypothetical protein